MRLRVKVAKCLTVKLELTRSWYMLVCISKKKILNNSNAQRRKSNSTRDVRSVVNIRMLIIDLD